jgi:hypothetical protein
MPVNISRPAEIAASTRQIINVFNAWFLARIVLSSTR